MSTGIRAEVKVDSPDTCQVAAASRGEGASAHSVTKSSPPGDPMRVSEEFVVDSAVDVDGDTFEEVFAYGDRSAYRFTRERGCECPCECVERHDCPVVEVYTHGSTLYVTFHAPDMACLREVLSDLRERYPQLDVQRLMRSATDRSDRDLVVVDRNELTDRQFEVLQTAHRLGYFEHPKEANAGEIAEHLGVTRATFTEHLAAAQSKLLAAVVGE